MGHTRDPTPLYLCVSWPLSRCRFRRVRKQIQETDIDWKEHTARQAAGKPKLADVTLAGGYP